MVQPQGPNQPPQPYGQQPPQYQQPQYQQPGPGYPGQYQGGPPQGGKKVGPGGCLTSIGIFVLSIIAFVGIFVWAIAGIVTTLKDAPSVPVGQTSTVNITQTGETFVFFGNLDSTSTSLPILDPDVTVTDPSGNVVPFSRGTTSASGSSGDSDFRLIGDFDAKTTGTYTIESEDMGRPGLSLYITHVDVTNVVGKVVAAFAIGGLLFLLSVILAIVWLVRRSNAKKAPV